MQSAAPLDLRRRLAQVGESRLMRQNLVLFAGGLIAGLGGFAYHAIAGRVLGPEVYGQVASLIAVYAVGTAPAYILIVVLAKYVATLAADGDAAGIRSLVLRVTTLVDVPSLVFVGLTAIFGRAVADYFHLASPVPILVLGLSIALVWQVAIPRGVLQGLQRFQALSLNLALEMIVRTATIALLVGAYAVSGAMAAVLAGLAVSFVIGLYSLRDRFGSAGPRVRLRAMAGFSLTAAVGIIGVQLLFNQDVILASRYLAPHQAGIYAGLNKIGTILYFLTLSVSQVLFPRVIEAVKSDEHPGRILLIAIGIISALCLAALGVFALVPGLIVDKLYGAGFRDAVPYVVPVGIIGLVLSLNNLLVQFFMAVHDRWFMPILAVGCLMEGVLIVVFHASVGQVVVDVITALVVLLVMLAIRCQLLLPHLHPESLLE